MWFKINKKLVFTLVEVLIVMVVLSMVFVMLISLYFKMMRTRVDVEARQSLVQNSYSVMEKLNLFMKDYTLDYEEYFNRRIVWCDWSNWWDGFSWNTTWAWNPAHCDNFTHYWNSSWLSWASGWNPWANIYYCSHDISIWNSNPDDWWNRVVKLASVDKWSGCRQWDTDIVPLNKPQSYWEYKQQFWDYFKDRDGVWWVVWDDDDKDVWSWTVAIWDHLNIKELYLISKDWKNRLFLRRSLLATWNFDNKWPWWEADIEKWYNVQMLKLKWFDAWSWHDFQAIWKDTYDWQIDTWACDFSQWFEWHWDSIHYWWMNNYKLPKDNNDCRINLFWKDLTLSSWNMQIFPVKSADYSWNDDNVQINPYIKINIKTKIYWEPWFWKINPASLSWYQMDLQTTFNIKTNY